MKLPFLEHPRIINTLLTLGAAVLGVLLIVGIGDNGFRNLPSV